MPLDDPEAPACPLACGHDALAPEEEAVLRRMRALRQEANALRAQLAAPPAAGHAAGREAARARLAALRAAFAACQRELEAANELKLRRLGHIR